MEKRATEVTGGVSFCLFLATILIVLKLEGLVSWSWWWVTAPLWAPVGFLLLLATPFIVWLIVHSK